MKLDVPKLLNSPAIENVVIAARNGGVQDVPQPPDFGALQPDPTLRKKRRDERQTVPPELVKEIVAAAQSIRENHKVQFLADRKLKDRAARLFRTMLPPRPRRPGRKPIASVTRAIRLLRKMKRRYPNAKPEQIWAKVYPKVIPKYDQPLQRGSVDGAATAEGPSAQPKRTEAQTAASL